MTRVKESYVFKDNVQHMVCTHVWVCELNEVE